MWMSFPEGIFKTCVCTLASILIGHAILKQMPSWELHFSLFWPHWFLLSFFFCVFIILSFYFAGKHAFSEERKNLMEDLLRFLVEDFTTWCPVMFADVGHFPTFQSLVKVLVLRFSSHVSLLLLSKNGFYSFWTKSSLSISV